MTGSADINKELIGKAGTLSVPLLLLLLLLLVLLVHIDLPPLL